MSESPRHPTNPVMGVANSLEWWTLLPNSGEEMSAEVLQVVTALRAVATMPDAIERLEAVASIHIAGGGDDCREAWRTAIGLLRLRIREDEGVANS